MREKYGTLKLAGMGFILLFLSCEKECLPPVACSLEPDAGLCKAYMPRYYYDSEEKKCKEFIWGGCGGTVPFETLEECQECLCIDGKGTGVEGEE